MKSILAVLFLISACEPAYADINLMVGVGQTALTNNLRNDHEPFERMGSLGYTLGISDPLYVRGEVGGWMGGVGMQSWYAAIQLGARVYIPQTGFYCHLAIGPAYLAYSDYQVLSGHPQFLPEAGCGLKASYGWMIGAAWKHMSNAGIDHDASGAMLPNHGRDWLGLQLDIPINFK
jgi:hypothetical protein